MRRGGRRLPELPETTRSLCVAAVAVGRKEGDRQVEASIAAAHAFEFECWRLLYVGDRGQQGSRFCLDRDIARPVACEPAPPAPN